MRDDAVLAFEIYLTIANGLFSLDWLPSVNNHRCAELRVELCPNTRQALRIVKGAGPPIINQGSQPEAIGQLLFGKIQKQLPNTLPLMLWSYEQLIYTGIFHC